MSSTLPTPGSSYEGSAHSPSTSRPRSQRVLACDLCQKRKVKCDRCFPCANCTRRGVVCVPVAQPRPRRRRFPERALLDRLREAEDLLRRNNVNVSLLDGPDAPASRESSVETSDQTDIASQRSEVPSASSGRRSRKARARNTHEAKSMWRAMGRKGPDPDNDEVPVPAYSGRDISFKMAAMNRSFANDNQILFGTPDTTIDLSTLHPEPVHIFRLWQVYLDNVNPLVKVIHAPSLQGRIIEVAGDIKNISPTFQTLLFSIYCVATMSLPDDECESVFGDRKEHLLAKYHFACHQSLVRNAFLRSNDRDSLTAFFMYLLSAYSSTYPQSVWPLMGLMIRVAQRMDIHSEAANLKHSVFEAEMRRRLWWAIVILDSRMSEFADHKATILNPTWDCKLPLNVSDSDLDPEMKELPAARGTVSEAMLVTVRCEIDEFLRHTPFFLDFTNPSLKPIAKPLPGLGRLSALTEKIETEYIGSLNPDNNPVHFMTVWMSRAFISKYHLMEHYSRYNDPSMPQADADRDRTIKEVFNILEYDERLVSSPLSKRFAWYLWLHFPLPAYIYIAQDIRRRPLSQHVDKAWRIMSCSYGARFASSRAFTISHTCRMLPMAILQAWEACEAAWAKAGKPMETPEIVKIARMYTYDTETNCVATTDTDRDNSEYYVGNMLMSTTPDFGTTGDDLTLSMAALQSSDSFRGWADLTSDLDQSGDRWPIMGWSSGQQPGW